MRNRKVNFEWNGIQFKNVPIDKYMGRVASVARQYAKAKYGAKIQTRTDSFSMGSSIDIYVDPRSVTPEVYKELAADMAHRFDYHTFDSMTDYSGYKTIGKHGWEPVRSFIDGGNYEFTAKYANVYLGVKYESSQREAIQEYLENNPEWEGIR